MYINNLTTNTAYQVRVRAATQSLVGERRVHRGDWSEVKAVYLQPGCENLSQFVPAKTENQIILLNLDEHLGTIAGIICAVLGLLSVILAILLCRCPIMCTSLINHPGIHRRCRQDRSGHYADEKYYKNSSPPLSKHNIEGGGWEMIIFTPSLWKYFPNTSLTSTWTRK